MIVKSISFYYQLVVVSFRNLCIGPSHSQCFRDLEIGSACTVYPCWVAVVEKHPLPFTQHCPQPRCLPIREGERALFWHRLEQVFASKWTAAVNQVMTKDFIHTHTNAHTHTPMHWLHYVRQLSGEHQSTNIGFVRIDVLHIHEIQNVGLLDSWYV